jgi:hypothetical protein
VTKPMSKAKVDKLIAQIESIKTLPALIRKVREMYEDNKDIDAFYEGRFGNTRWRLFGPDCDSQAKGELHLANNELFDRWSNSLTVTVHLWCINHEEGSFKKIITNTFNIFE